MTAATSFAPSGRTRGNGMGGGLGGPLRGASADDNVSAYEEAGSATEADGAGTAASVALAQGAVDGVGATVAGWAIADGAGSGFTPEFSEVRHPGKSAAKQAKRSGEGDMRLDMEVGAREARTLDAGVLSQIRKSVQVFSFRPFSGCFNPLTIHA